MRVCDRCGERGRAEDRMISVWLKEEGRLPTEWGPFDLHESCLGEWIKSIEAAAR